MDLEENVTLKNLHVLIFQQWGGCKSGSMIGFFAQELQKQKIITSMISPEQRPFCWSKYNSPSDLITDILDIQSYSPEVRWFDRGTFWGSKKIEPQEVALDV